MKLSVVATLIPYYIMVTSGLPVLIPSEDGAMNLAEDNIEERGSYFEGDMILSPTIFSGSTDKRSRWPNATVPFELDPAFSPAEISVIYAGINDITSHTCVRFTSRKSETDYVYVERGGTGSGCNSYVGRVGGRQRVNLQAPGCLKSGTVSHELIHVLGFRHEHSRSDRDDYISIQWDNIQDGLAYAFSKYDPSVVNPFGVPYDYGSVMHYSQYAFTKGSGKPTIVPKKSGVSIGQRKGLSAYDMQKINNMYNCQS